MQVKKIIPNIEPFGEFYYYNCFYSSLIPAILSYNKSIMPVLVNGVFYYRINYDVSDMCMCAGYEHIKDLKELLCEQGINLKVREKSDCILEDIIESISLGKLVIVWLDCFYESIRNDLYMKEHWRHSILFYGFDLTEKVFFIIEHDKREDIEYRKKTISFEDVVNSYQGYLTHYHQNNIMSYIELSCLNNTVENGNLDQYKVKYLENLKIAEKSINTGLAILRNTVEVFIELFDDEDLLSKRCEKVILGLNDIIEAKRAERYTITKLFGQDDLQITLHDRSSEYWKAVRAVFARYQYSNIYRPKSFQNAKNNLKEIYSIESEYYRSLLNM